MLVGGFQVIDGTITWPSLLAFVMAVRVMHTPFKPDASGSTCRCIRHHASLGRIVDFSSDAAGSSKTSADAKPLIAPPPSVIACENVGFDYGDTVVLSDISIVYARGRDDWDRRSIGSRQDDVTKPVLIRLYDPCSGRVLFDGHGPAGIFDWATSITKLPLSHKNLFCFRQPFARISAAGAPRPPIQK